MRRRTLALLLLIFTSIALARPHEQDARIDFLIATLTELSDATFVRNGQEYDGKAAANHLRTKLRAAGERVQTAEEFIATCASASSMSGIKYQIHRGKEFIDAQDFLREALTRYDRAHVQP
jgi:hypothetical protein